MCRWFRDEGRKSIVPSTSIRQQKYPLIINHLRSFLLPWRNFFNWVSWDLANIELMMWCNVWLHQHWSNLHTGTCALLTAFPLSHGHFAAVSPGTSVSICFFKEGGSVLVSSGGAIWFPLRPSKQPKHLDWVFWHQENPMMCPLSNPNSLMRSHRRWWPLLSSPRWRALFLGV